MRSALRGLRRRAAAADDRDSGFTLIELLMASMVVIVVMTALASSLSSSLRVESVSTQKQTAAALAEQVIEQVRALPFADVAAGMSTNDISSVQSSAQPDPNIQGSSAPYTFAPTGEQIVSGSTSSNPPAPLYPYRTGSGPINATPYTVETYVTEPSTQLCTGCYRVTVIATWLPAKASNQVATETLISSPTTGCLSSNTHPFAAPCQPFFYAEATSGAGAVVITPLDPNTPAIGDLLGGEVSLETAQLGLFQDDATLQSEQVSEVSGSAQTSQVSFQTAVGNAFSGGGATATAQADNDPAIDTNMSTPTYISQTGADSVTQSSSAGNALSVSASNGDSGSLISTTSASLASDCYDLSSLTGTAQTTGLPCGSESVTQNGTGSGSTQTTNATLSAVVSLASPGLGTASLASIAPVTNYTPTRAFAAYYQAGAGGSAECVAPTGNGCVHAGATENVGTIALGGAPSGLTALSGWAGFLVRVTNYSASVSAESGGGAAGPTASCSYTIQYWTGSGYSTTSCGSSGQTITAQYAPTPALVNGQLVTLAIGGTFQTGAATTSTSGGGESGQVTPPLSGDITYSLSVAGISIVNLNIAVNLGTLLAQTDYQAAPSAS